MQAMDAFLKLFEKAVEKPVNAPVVEREPWADHSMTCRCIFHR